MKKWGSKLILLTLIVIAFFAFKHFELGQYLSLEYLKSQKQQLQSSYLENPSQFIVIYFVIYVLTTALSLPGAAVLTLAGGALFGVLVGTVVVSFASTIGATLAFLASRWLLRESIQSKFKDKLKSINEGVKKEGAFYLFTLRLIPVFPFFLINLVMGLTPIKTVTFFVVSQLGMLAGTVVYVNAGTQLAQINSLKDVLSVGLLGSFALIGLLPIASKKIISYLKARKYLKQHKKPKNFDYNIIVIGGGSAGLVTSYIAAAVKAKVALVEKNKMGGDCLNTGCVPSKSIIKSAKVAQLIRQAKEYGLAATDVNINFNEVMGRVHRIIKKIEPHDSVERYSGLGVDCYQAEAKIISPYEVKIGDKFYTTKNIVIATGASPRVPSIPGLEGVMYLTSENLWELKELPKKLVVLGGGAIGCELSQAFQRLGSDVTLVNVAPNLLDREDLDVSEAVESKFKKEGVNLVLGAMPTQVRASDNVLVCEKDGREIEIPFDKLLIATGRQANVKGFGLESLSIELTQQGTIAADELLRTTNYPNIYVCGDVTGPYQFTHTAAHQAWYAAVNALFSPLKTFKVDYSVIPMCTFTEPEVARVGLSEKEAQQKGIDYEVTKYGVDDLDRAIAENEDYGFVKVITPKGSDKILGATIVSTRASDMITEFITAMKYKVGLNKILGTIHIYPTFSEANKFAAGVWKKQNAPEELLKWVEKFHKFRR